MLHYRQPLKDLSNRTCWHINLCLLHLDTSPLEPYKVSVKLEQVDIESTAWYRVPPGQAIDVKDLSSHNYEL